MIGCVAFRVDSGTAIGAGHLTRCLALANELALQGVASKFISRDHAGHLIDLARTAGHATLLLERTSKASHDPHTWLGASLEADAHATATALSNGRDVDWLIVDHYGVDATWHDIVRVSCGRLFAIDDLANRRMRVDVLLDHNYNATEKPYTDLASQAQLLLGPRYALLDPRVEQSRVNARATTPRPEHECRVLISLGGTDPGDATSWVVSALTEELSRAEHVDVVIGRSHPAPESVRHAMQSINNSSLHVQTSAMPTLLANADLAIGAGGVSTLERACVGVPSICIAVAANQSPALKALDRDGLLVHVNLNRANADSLIRAYRTLMTDMNQRAKMSAASRRAVDGLGLKRVTDVLLGKQLNKLSQKGSSYA